MSKKFDKMTKTDLRDYIANVTFGFLQLRTPLYDSMVEVHKEKTDRSVGFVAALHTSMNMITQVAINILEDMQQRELLIKEHALILEQLKAEKQQIEDILAKKSAKENNKTN